MFDILECHNDVDLQAVSLCPISRYDMIHFVYLERNKEMLLL